MNKNKQVVCPYCGEKNERQHNSVDRLIDME